MKNVIGVKPTRARGSCAVSLAILLASGFLSTSEILAQQDYGIDCAAAATPQDFAICSDPSLLALDAFLTEAYLLASEVVPPAQFSNVQKTQRAWIGQRDRKCGDDIQCLSSETKMRTAWLSGFVQSYVEQQNEILPAITREEGLREELTAEEIYAIASASSVVVLAYDDPDAGYSQGSGVVISKHSVATNCHVVGELSQVGVMFGGDWYSAADIVGDYEADFCIIYVPGLPANPVELADMDQVRPAQRVYSIGSPRGLRMTIGDGLVSGWRDDDCCDFPLIQSSAPISPGSSGGGLFDENGRLVGITTKSRVDSQNLNFAVPISAIESIAKGYLDSYAPPENWVIEPMQDAFGAVTFALTGSTQMFHLVVDAESCVEAVPFSFWITRNRSIEEWDDDEIRLQLEAGGEIFRTTADVVQKPTRVGEDLFMLGAALRGGIITVVEGLDTSKGLLIRVIPPGDLATYLDADAGAFNIGEMSTAINSVINYCRISRVIPLDIKQE